MAQRPMKSSQYYISCDTINAKLFSEMKTMKLLIMSPSNLIVNRCVRISIGTYTSHYA